MFFFFRIFIFWISNRWAWFNFSLLVIDGIVINFVVVLFGREGWFDKFLIFLLLVFFFYVGVILIVIIEYIIFVIFYNYLVGYLVE